MLADDSLPVVEIRADRTVIYPQRMELTGEETLMDVLQMVPDLLITDYEEIITFYNLRIDNGRFRCATIRALPRVLLVRVMCWIST